MTALRTETESMNLATMSLHLDQMLTDATAKNLSLAKPWNARRSRSRSPSPASIERRFKLSRLQSNLPLTASTLPPQVSLTAQDSHPSPARSRLLRNGTTCVSSVILA